MERYNFVWFIRNEEDKNRYYYELDLKKNVRFIYKSNAFSNNLLSKIFRFSFSVKVNKHFQIPWKSFLLNRIYRSINFENEKKLIFIFNQGWYDKTIIRWLRKKHPEIRTVFYCDDTIECFAKEIPDLKPEKLGDEFDLVLCYNPGDVKRYGYYQINACLSKHHDLKLSQNENADISFIGQAKDRDKLLYEIYDFLNGKCNMDFLLVGSTNAPNKNITVSDKYLTYREYLSRECSSNCILELVKGDTEGATLRCWEAVYYNKKIITNWKGIFDFQFYDSRYMRYFEKPEDIDIKFVTQRIPVDYGYQGQNSPTSFLTDIADKVQAL